MTTRRGFLLGTAGLSAVAAAGAIYAVRAESGAGSGATFPVARTEEEWRAILTEDQFAVLRREATERPFSSPLNDEKRAGTFLCAGCGNPLYSSEHKYDSGTGWPSFWQPIGEEAVGLKQDWALVWPRTEVHCARCGGHQGHVFDDGPPPTGKRHCINGLAMTFEPTAGTAAG
jgi:peptide-methionine (R)-S-oxide reductase